MPVTGLVAHLSEDASTRAETRAALEAHPAVTVGPERGPKLALVTETERAEDDPVLFRELQSLAGVRLLSVVFHDFSDVEGMEGTVPKRWGRRRAKADGTT